MVYDRQITISTAGSRKAKLWQGQALLLSELYGKLQTPHRSSESQGVYLSMKKGQQDDLKDVGGFVAGALQDGRRKAGSVVSREILTLDLDSIPAGGTEGVLQALAGLGCGYGVYSTRKHHPGSPRLRVLIPLDRPCTADEYEPLARRMAAYIGLSYCDPSTFEASRLMYWPSVCADGAYLFQVADKAFVSADGLLSQYQDWRNVQEWPQVPGISAVQRLAAKQEDPTAKRGIVGAFCRVYNVFRVMEELIPGVYEPVEGERFTYLGGSTTGGAVVYDGGNFLFSHHATDPCGGQLCNAFDLVRLHRYAHLDEEAKEGTPPNKLPSYGAMKQFAAGLPEVSGLLDQERFAEISQVFGEVEVSDDPNWGGKLQKNSEGVILKTMDNVWLILEHDPLLKGRFALNKFAGRGEVLAAVPWQAEERRRFWDDNDSYGLYWYLERFYGITGNQKIDGALSLHSAKHAFNDVTSYLERLSWDGVERLDRVFIDYLGAEDSPYVRGVTRKAFTAAIARALVPGIKFDCMTILSGAQGLGKSTLLRKMSKGWFSDSIRSFEGKEASELLQGVWLVEVSELDAFRRTDVSRIKQFLSLQVDRYRAAYGHFAKDFPRCCVFFGTTNASEYLQDRTGNRRFWPIDVGVHPATLSVFRDLDPVIDQLWAEASVRFRAGEPLYLQEELEATAKVKQEEHREVSIREGLIADFLEQPIPEDWAKWNLQRRRMFWDGSVTGETRLVQREQVCALEIWCEALEQDPRMIKNADAREINEIIRTVNGWEYMQTPGKFGYCKSQRGFKRVYK